MRITVLASAERDLKQAAAYYLEHTSQGIAQAFLNDFLHAKNLLADYPELGRAVSDSQRIAHFRHFPYSIIYRVHAEHLSIRAIAHHRRKPRV